MKQVSDRAKRIVVALTGASGAELGITALRMLAELPEVESHVVITRAARDSIHEETDLTIPQVEELADVVHVDHDLASPLASGSYPVDGMLVAPCSIKTLSGIANSFDESLVIRAADVMLKERRKLVLLLRETPLHAGHIRLMAQATEAGAILMPPVPAYYLRPTTLAQASAHTIGRALELVDIHIPDIERWEGRRKRRQQ